MDQCPLSNERRIRLYHQAADLAELVEVIHTWAARRGFTMGQLGEILAEAGRLARPQVEAMMATAMAGQNPVPTDRRDEAVPPVAMD